MHIEIAVCDDDESELKFLKSQIDTFMRSHKIEGNITLFSCGEDFLSAERGKLYDIVFMDIYMTGINGVDAILEASSRNAFQLVFITVSQEHAVEAFSLNAAHYLVKPITEGTVGEAMNRCLTRMRANRQNYIDNHINIKTNNGTIPIPISHIVYIEVSNKTCIIYTEKKHYITNSSLDSIYELLDDDTFMRAQRSFVVNMSYIESFSYGRIILKNGKEITPSRNNWNELKKQYHQFLFHLARAGNEV